MKLTCPKCGLSLPIDPAGTSGVHRRQICRGCSAKIVVTEVSMACGDFTGKKMYCSLCGRMFPYAVACPFCKVAFASVLLVYPDQSMPVREEQAGQPEKKNRLLSGRLGTALAGGLRRITRRVWVGTACSAIAVALILGVASRYRAARDYPRNYVLALYGIKSGFDRGSGIGRDLLVQWRSSSSSALAPPATDGEALAELETVKREVDGVMEELESPPGPLRDASAVLDRLYALYERQNALARAPQGSPDTYERALHEVEEKFTRALEELKATMPVPLREEVRNAGKHYKLGFIE